MADKFCKAWMHFADNLFFQREKERVMRSMDFDLILIKREELVSQNQADSLLRKTLCKEYMIL